MPTVETRIVRVIADQIGIAARRIKLADRLEDDLALDSLDKMELVMGLEEAFDIEIPDDRAKKVVTVGDVGRLIDAILKEEE